MNDDRRTPPRGRRPERVIDPYVVVSHTWSREELLRERARHGGVEIVEPHRPAA